jgi:hypothetical protein
VHIPGVAPHGVAWLPVMSWVCWAQEVQAQSHHTDRRDCSCHISAQHSNNGASRARRSGTTQSCHIAHSHRTPGLVAPIGLAQLLIYNMISLTYNWFAFFSNFLKYNLTFVIKQKLELSTCPPHTKNKKNILTSQRTLFEGNRWATWHQIITTVR